MVHVEGLTAVIPGASGEVFGWGFELQGKFFSLGIQISAEELTLAEELDTRVHSMSTEDMGIAQRTEALSQKIQEAIMAGETQRAQDLMAQLSAGGSFYQQEWEACHRVLAPSSREFCRRVAQGLQELAQVWGIPAPELAIALVQALPYGGSTGIGHPAYLTAQGQGACAGKTYFLYLLLRALGQYPGLLGSADYNHFMLGLEQGRGKSLMIQGKKYFFLEVTAPGWEVGQIPEDRQDLSLWEGFLLD